ncbi:MAG: TIGR03087 family PEP-CTERM/XrtA system glycosyltransferase [Sphingomonadales bacterium]
MPDLLFLAHRIPYPPDKGDKIRSWHILKFLAERMRVHLGCFIDDQNDRPYIDKLRDLCASTHFVSLDPLKARLASLRGLVRGEPLSLAFYRSRSMARWVDARLARDGIDHVFLFSSPMAQYVLGNTKRAITVMDFVDVDSDKWAQYAAGKSWPQSVLYNRESRRLLEFERRVARRASASLFVSSAEAGLFRALAPESNGKIRYMNNGVDFDFFSPEVHYDDPYGGEGPCLVFTGAMDYWANVDAVEWFAREVFPAVLAKAPQARFFIVGGRPTGRVRALSALNGVAVTGRVPDVRPYIAHAAAAVAPLRIARGVQNKVLEAMAMAKPVVATSQAAEGIEARPGAELMVANGAVDFAQAIADILGRSNDNNMGGMARDRIITSYDWSKNLTLLERMYRVGNSNQDLKG